MCVWVFFRCCCCCCMLFCFMACEMRVHTRVQDVRGAHSRIPALQHGNCCVPFVRVFVFVHNTSQRAEMRVKNACIDDGRMNYHDCIALMWFGWFFLLLRFMWVVWVCLFGESILSINGLASQMLKVSLFVQFFSLAFPALIVLHSQNCRSESHKHTPHTHT